VPEEVRDEVERARLVLPPRRRRLPVELQGVSLLDRDYFEALTQLAVEEDVGPDLERGALVDRSAGGRRARA